MKRNLPHRLLAFSMALVLMITMSGCLNVSEDQAEQRIKTYICTRYGTKYEIGYISFQENLMFGGGSYHTTVTEKESGLSFSVTCEGFTGQITDNYAETLYKDQMNEKVRSILDSCSFISEYRLTIVWKTSPAGWRPSMSFEEFFKTYSNVDILLGLALNDQNPKQRAQSLLELFQELEADHNYLNVELWRASEPYHSSVFIFGEEAEELKYIENQLQKMEDFDNQIKAGTSIVEEYSFMKLHEVDVDSFSDHIRLVFKLKMSEEEPAEKAEDVYELCCRLNAQEFDFYVMIINSVQLGDGEEKTKYQTLYRSDMESLDDVSKCLSKLDFSPEENEPTEETAES